MCGRRSSVQATPVAVALGSNLGDRLEHLRSALTRLQTSLDDLRASSVFETEPVPDTDQPPFLNACVAGRTRLTPRQLLSALQGAERAAGRRSTEERWGPRVLDLDILLYGEQVIRQPDLEVPHPRMRERAFVLVPLAEIAPHWVIPGPPCGDRTPTVADLAGRIGTRGLWRTEKTLT